MTWTRRDFLKAGAASAVLPALAPRIAFSAPVAARSLITRAIPSTGETVPVVGVGMRNYRTDWAENGDLTNYRETLRTFVEGGGRVVDTAPSYGDSEALLGRFMTELGLRDRLFVASKVDRAGRDEGIAGMRASMEKMGTATVDLLQVHNLRDVDVQLATLREWKASGLVRYIGITTSSDRQYDDFATVARSQGVDFIQVDYALGNRNAADDLLPLALDRGIAVLVNMPFGRGDAFRRVGDRAIPEWANELGIASWGQFFLKYVVSHPAVTAAIPGTTKPHHATDNLGAAMGELPDTAMRARMEAFYDALPAVD